MRDNLCCKRFGSIDFSAIGCEKKKLYNSRLSGNLCGIVGVELWDHLVKGLPITTEISGYNKGKMCMEREGCKLGGKIVIKIKILILREQKTAGQPPRPQQSKNKNKNKKKNSY